MPKRNANSDPRAEEETDMDCESDGGEDGERVRLLPRRRTPSKAEWERHVPRSNSVVHAEVCGTVREYFQLRLHSSLNHQLD